MLKNNLLVAAGVATLAACSQAQTIFSSGAETLNDFTVALGSADNEAIVVDYGDMTVAGTNWQLDEAPSMIGGSAATTGILMRANFDSAASATGHNLILGGTPLEITASQYIFTFDMFIKADDPVTGSGTTEQGIWGVGRDNTTDYIGRPTRTTNGSGTWGWAAGEGGYGTEDYSAWTGTTNFGTLTDGSVEAQTAFANYEYTGAPSGAWTTVEIIVDGDNVQVSYNGSQFWDITGADASGYAMIGYEDPFSSIAGAPDSQWMVIDNVEVEVVPEPMTMTLLGAGALALLRKRRKAN